MLRSLLTWYDNQESLDYWYRAWQIVDVAVSGCHTCGCQASTGGGFNYLILVSYGWVTGDRLLLKIGCVWDFVFLGDQRAWAGTLQGLRLLLFLCRFRPQKCGMMLFPSYQLRMNWNDYPRHYEAATSEATYSYSLILFLHECMQASRFKDRLCGNLLGCLVMGEQHVPWQSMK